MKLEGKKIILESRECWHCHGTGQALAMVDCPTCHGTGKGIKGGANGCRTCSGMRKTQSHTLRETCQSCDGAGHVPENNCDSMPDEWFSALPFKVYRSNRNQTYNEYLLGHGCVYSCTDYGRAYKADDATVIAEVSKHTYIQVCTVANKENQLCDHIGIFVNRDGYSVRACFAPDGLDAAATLARENGKENGFAVGAAIARQGGNGTMGAIYKD